MSITITEFSSMPCLLRWVYERIVLGATIDPLKGSKGSHETIINKFERLHQKQFVESPKL